MDLTQILILDRTDWAERCNWIEQNCDEWHDYTNWDLWGLGLSDIEYYVPEKCAIIYYLTWAR